MKMVALPSGKQHCIHGPAVNVPSKLDNVCELLPHLPSESELVPFKLKRKLSYKGHYMYDYVHPDKVMSALRWLKANNPLYKDVTINEDWVNDSLTTGSELFTGLTEPTEESMDTDNTCTEESMDTKNMEESNTCTEETMETSCTQPQSANDVLSSIASRNGFIIHAVPDDGNCLFSAIAYQLASIGIPDIDANTLRAMVVSHLEDHPHINGVHYRSFLSALVAANDPRNADTEAPTAVDDYISTIDDPDTRAQLRWLRYLERLHNDAWGDNIAIQGICEMLSVTINVLSMHNPSIVSVTPSSSASRGNIYLGLVQQYHYVGLDKVPSSSSHSSSTMRKLTC